MALAAGPVSTVQKTSHAHSTCNPLLAAHLACAHTLHEQAVAGFMADNNSGRPISPDRVLSFSSPDAANDWLRLPGSAERVAGGVHFTTPGRLDWHQGGFCLG